VVREQARGKRARAAIAAYLADRDKAAHDPTVREIATAIGLSVAATHRHLVILRGDKS
jgi:DNA-binding MurR/RpiR family transcriptional regulator